MEDFKIEGKISLNGIDQFNSDVDEATDKGSAFASKLKTGLTAVAKVATVALTAAATATVAITKASIEAYAEYEQLVGGVETLFGAGGQSFEEYAKTFEGTQAEALEAYKKLIRAQNEVMDNAANAYKTAGLSANDYMETVTSFSASLLQGLGGDTVKAAEIADMAIIDMADNANKMGTSIENIQAAYQGFAKQNYTMLDNLKLGYGGTQSEMVRLINDSGILNETISDLDNITFDQMIEAIHVVQTEMGITETTAKEASTTIQGSINSLKSAWENLLVGISDDEADFDGLVSNVVESVGTVADNLIPRISIALKGISRLIADLAPVIAEELPGLIEEILPDLLEAASAILEALVEAAPSLLSTLLEIAPDLISTLMELGTQLTISLLQMTPEIVAAALQILVAVLHSLSENLPLIIKTIVEVIPEIITALIEAAPDILEAAVTLFMSIVEAIPEIIPPLLEALPEIIEGITTTLSESIPIIVDAYIALMSVWEEALPDIIDALVEVLPEIIAEIVVFFAESIPDIIDAAVDLFIAICEAIPEVLPDIIEAIPEIIVGICDALIKAAPDIQKAGEDMLMALVDAVPAVLEALKKALTGVWNELVDWFLGVQSGVPEDATVTYTGVSWGNDTGLGGAGRLIGKTTESDIVETKSMPGNTQKYATGLDYVPYDDFPAYLHQGEMVLPANQADYLRSGAMSASNEQVVDLLNKILEAVQTPNSISINNREFGRIVRTVI